MNADSIRKLLAKHRLAPNKRLGQNFLVSESAREAIADAACSGPEQSIVEIGPGLGALTTLLCTRKKEVVAVEHDRGLAEVLGGLTENVDNLIIQHGDALTVDFGAVVAGRPAIVGNLPYSITSGLLLALLAQRARIGTTTVMIQTEVADRLLAEPHSKAYGSLTLLFQLHAEVIHLFDVPGSAFWPAPKVSSTVIQISWRPEPAISKPLPEIIEKVVRGSFAQRRKTLRNNLRAKFGADAIAKVEAFWPEILSRRAETLSLSDFARLAEAIEDSIA